MSIQSHISQIAHLKSKHQSPIKLHICQITNTSPIAHLPKHSSNHITHLSSRTSLFIRSKHITISPNAFLSSHSSKIESPIASPFAYPSNRTYQIKSPIPSSISHLSNHSSNHITCLFNRIYLKSHISHQNINRLSICISIKSQIPLRLHIYLNTCGIALHISPVAHLSIHSFQTHRYLSKCIPLKLRIKNKITNRIFNRTSITSHISDQIAKRPATAHLSNNSSIYIARLFNHISIQSLPKSLIRSYRSLTRMLIRSHHTYFNKLVSNQISNLVASPIALLSSHTSKIESPIAHPITYPSTHIRSNRQSIFNLTFVQSLF